MEKIMELTESDLSTVAGGEGETDVQQTFGTISASTDAVAVLERTGNHC